MNHILGSIYEGLRDLNKQGLCHGDLSLDNVLIDEKGHIKLIDFGRANYEQEVRGTPPFIAPEILQGVRSNFLSDLYALGVIEAVAQNPDFLPSLKNMKREDFKNHSPLLSLDPAKRVFPYSRSEALIHLKGLRALSFKVKELLSLRESRRCVTLKNPASKKRFFSFSRIKKIGFFMALAFLGWASPVTSSSPQGLIKIYTYEWFEIRVGEFKSYTPVILPLHSGWHLIEWKSKEGKGKMKVFVSQGKTLFLNDKSFLEEKAYP